MIVLIHLSYDAGTPLYVASYTTMQGAIDAQLDWMCSEDRCINPTVKGPSGSEGIYIATFTGRDADNKLFVYHMQLLNTDELEVLI